MALEQDKPEQLQSMIMTFRVTELQALLGFAGRNKIGKKHELQNRALELTKIRSTPMQNKIRELYQTAIEAQQTMMGPGGQPLQYNAAAYSQMMGLAGYAAGQQVLTSGRNPYTQATAYAATAAAAPYGSQAYQMKPGAAVPQPANVKFKKLPFYDIHGELLQPTSLITQGNQRFQEAQFQFYLTPQQATDIASNRDIRMGSKLDYLYQVQLRFCPLDPSAEQGDEFPPSICVQVNGKMCPLPNPIPTNKPNVEPKRPPRPNNITPLCKLSPTLANTVNIKWAADYAKGWVVGIWLVEKLTSEDLLDRLKKKGIKPPEYTRELIKKKLTSDDDDIATDNLKVTVSCPLGKMRMSHPCRPSTCVHLQCFDAMLFLQMNERKPTWQCPVCDSPALYDTLLVDGFFQEVIKSPELPLEENEIILNNDGTWNPVPVDEEEKKKEEKKNDEADAECVDLSDDEGGEAPAAATPAPADASTPAPGSVPPPTEEEAAPLPPLPPAEIECIDLE